MSPGESAAGVDRFRKLIEASGRRVRANGSGKFKAQCPCHKDHEPSMDFLAGEHVPVIAKCRVCGAGLLEMLNALNATPEDRDVILGGKRESKGQGPGASDGVWLYVDEAGALLFRVHRTTRNGKKEYPCERWSGAGWAWGTSGVRLVPYQLPELLAAVRMGHPIYLCEGEKCCEAVRALGLVATTSPGGAQRWLDEYARYFVGATIVYVLEDNDERGRNYGAAVIGSLASVGVADVRRVRFPELPEKGDVYDWLAALGDIGIAEKRQRLVERCDAPQAVDDSPDEPAIEVGRMVRATLSGKMILATHFERPQSLLGNGTISAGDLVVLYGQGGVAKTWLSLLLALAFATDGGVWFGNETGPAVPTGYMELELLGHTMQDRFRSLVGDAGVPEDFHLLVRPQLKGSVDLVNRDGQPVDLGELREWIEVFGLKVVVIDALARATTLDQVDFSPLLLALDVLRAEVQCAFAIIHHEPKNTDKGEDGDLDALRGDSRLRDFPQCLIRVVRHHGVLCARFAKVSAGPTPEPIYFELGETGVPRMRPKPEAAASAEETLDRFERFIVESATPVGTAAIMNGVLHLAGKHKGNPFSRSTVRDKVNALAEAERIAVFGHGNEVTYWRTVSGVSGVSDQEEPHTQ